MIMFVNSVGRHSVLCVVKLKYSNHLYQMSQQINKVFGKINVQMPSNVLPTIGDIIKAVCFARKNKEISKKNAIKLVVNEVIELWKSVSVPTVSLKRVLFLVQKYFRR